MSEMWGKSNVRAFLCHIISGQFSKQHLETSSVESIVLKQDKTHCQSKWVIKGYFAAFTDCRSDAADAENLLLTPEDWNTVMTAYEFTHTLTLSQPPTYLLCLNGSQQRRSISYSCPHLIFRHLRSPPVHLQTPWTHHRLTVRAKHAPPQPAVQNHSDTDYRRTFARLTVMVLTLPPGFCEVMKSLIVHSQWPWAPRSWISLLNNWDV